MYNALAHGNQKLRTLRTEGVVQSHAGEAEGAVDGPGWPWCWNGRLKKSPFISQGTGAVGSFHKHMEAWREQQGPWEEGTEVRRGAMVAPGWTM